MKTLKDIYDERVKGFDEEILMSETKGWGIHPDQLVAIDKHNHQTTLALLENMVEWLEGRKKDIENIKAPEGADIGAYVHCEGLRRDGYNTAIDDTINYLKEQIKLIKNV